MVNLFSLGKHSQKKQTEKNVTSRRVDSHVTSPRVGSLTLLGCTYGTVLL